VLGWAVLGGWMLSQRRLQEEERRGVQEACGGRLMMTLYSFLPLFW
jgi:hypothetical protein